MKLDQGELGLVNNEILQTTGSIQLKANFSNKANRLWPGELVNARLLVDTRHNGLTVPASVVQQGPKGTYAYVVNPDNTVAIRPIKVAQISDGQALIDSGLEADEQVVVDGQYKLQPGAHVRLLHGKAARKRPHKTLCRRPSHEHLRPVYPTADRHRAGDGRVIGWRLGRLSALAGGVAAQRQLSDAYDHGAAAGRRSADHGIHGGIAARAAVRRDPRPHPDDVGERVRLHPDHPAVRFESPRSTGRSAIRCRQSMPRSPICRRTCRIRRLIRKVNPAETPILVLGVTSDSLPMTVVDAYAQNILLQKISQISGVGLVGIGGEQQPAVRVQVDPQALAARGINLEDVRTVLGQANVDLPKGTLNSPRQTFTLNTNDQLFKPDKYADLIIAYRNGSPVRIRDIGQRRQCGRERADCRLVQPEAGRSFWRSSASPAPTSSRRWAGSRR